MQPFDVHIRLEGWALFFAALERTGEGGDALPRLRADVVARVRERTPDGVAGLQSVPAVARMRHLFRRAGCDPTRYRPSSEALLRRLLRGDDMPAIGTLVDLNNCLSADLAVPCCVMAQGTFAPPFDLRAGAAGEHYESLRGPFNLEGKPLLCDDSGPLDTPITGNARVKVTPDTDAAWFVAYLPAGVVDPGAVGETLERLVAGAPVVRVAWTHAA